MSYGAYRAMPVFCIGPFLLAMLGTLVVAGLVATPANCACGAGMPHAHSLFMLPGHHHAANGEHMRLGDPAHSGNQHHHVDASDGPEVQEMAGHASDRQAMLAGEPQPGSAAWQRWNPQYAPITLPEGQVTRPDPGPPQQRT